MKGLIKAAVVALGGAAALGAAGGCCNSSERDCCWDRCWPERYRWMAKQEVLEGFGAQVHNGHVLDQTVWNYHFEAGKDVLTPGGQEHLAYLARRRPEADPNVYLQTAQDLTYDPARPEEFTEKRSDLDARRTAAVQKYLTAYTAGHGTQFNVCVHDPHEVGMSAIPMNRQVLQMYQGARGILGFGGISVTGGAGAVPGP